MQPKQALSTAFSLLPNQNRKDILDILCFATDLKAEEIFLQPELSAAQFEYFLELLKQFASNKPLAYITGTQCFYNREFVINNSCLIPRNDSETIITSALENIYLIKNIDEINILDLCSGSGCLGITLACELEKEFKNITVTFADISSKAIKVAELNSQKLLKCNCRFLLFDLLLEDFENLKKNLPINHNQEKKFDIILCNPPYIAEAEIESLEKQVKDYEPKIALNGGKDGLKFYQHIFKNLYKITNLISFFEIGFDQKDAISQLCEINKFNYKFYKDTAQLDRVVAIYA
jgi:release factor glutamine methyltransferase